MSNIDTYSGDLVEHNFFATIGDYDTRNETPDNATKLPYTQIASDNILRTANNQFDHVMVSGVPLSTSRCLFDTRIDKFKDANGLEQPLNYFYALDIISINDVSHQTLTEEERKTQFSNAKLFVNRWNAQNYLNVVEFEVASNPKNLINLFGSVMATGEYRELILNKTSFTLDDIDEYKEVAFLNNLVSVGRIGNNYYLIVNNETNP